ncbi:MAG TPA: glycosyltransferase [Steroidobacteraceae bacterium]|nr:glycosyltransferase [Steroidobacteraceae bacterium]
MGADERAQEVRDPAHSIGAMTMSPRPRVFLYVQHLLGIGHLKRALTLARALQARGLRVTLASGGFEVPGLAAEEIDVVQLPPTGAADVTFRSLLDAAGKPIDDAWRRARCDALLNAYHRVDPQVLIVELFPFGRRQMRFEILPLLEAAAVAQPRPLIVSSVRDIVGGGQRDAARQRETLALVERYFDQVMVHGDPSLIAFGRSFGLADELGARLHYTGYVVDRAASVGSDPAAGRDEVIVSAGGGAVGRTLLETALRARHRTRLAQRIWRVLTGVNAPAQEFAAIERLAAQEGQGRVIVERTRDDFVTRLANCAVSVSQAGYNTVMELLGENARAVVVPFAAGAETEQSLRAGLLAERGLLHVVEESHLSPETLAQAIDRAATHQRRSGSALDLNGAQRSAELIARWVEECRR